MRILNASLEEDDLGDDIIIRGVLDQETLKFIGMACISALHFETANGVTVARFTAGQIAEAAHDE